MHGSVNCDSGENVEKVTQKTEKVGDGGEDSDKVTQKTGELVQESLSKSKEMEVVPHSLPLSIASCVRMLTNHLAMKCNYLRKIAELEILLVCFEESL